MFQSYNFGSVLPQQRAHGASIPAITKGRDANTRPAISTPVTMVFVIKISIQCSPKNAVKEALDLAFPLQTHLEIEK